MFKVYKNLSATIAAEIFRALQNNFNLKHSSLFFYTLVKTVYHGSESTRLRTENMELNPRYIERIKWCQFCKRHILNNGNLKTVHVGYVKRIYLMLD